jgi:hypothetical protein
MIIKRKKKYDVERRNVWKISNKHGGWQDKCSIIELTY